MCQPPRVYLCNGVHYRDGRRTDYNDNVTYERDLKDSLQFTSDTMFDGSPSLA